LAVRAELHCYFCGHSLGEVLVASRGRPTNAQLREAYGAQRPEAGPLWAGDKPRCPRCRAQLFLEHFEPARLRTAS
jgi:hypothetical protein